MARELLIARERPMYLSSIIVQGVLRRGSREGRETVTGRNVRKEGESVEEQ
jgi:hypothetical protein